MKSILLSFALLCAPLAFAEGAGEPETVRSHMTKMGVLLDEIWSLSATPDLYPQAADKVSELRGHLIKVIALLPPKVEAMEPKQRRLSTIEYHQFVARVIFLSSSLENALLGVGTPTSGESFERDVQNLMREISTAVGNAHIKFR